MNKGTCIFIVQMLLLLHRISNIIISASLMGEVSLSPMSGVGDDQKKKTPWHWKACLSLSQPSRGSNRSGTLILDMSSDSVSDLSHERQAKQGRRGWDFVALQRDVCHLCPFPCATPHTGFFKFFFAHVGYFCAKTGKTEKGKIILVPHLR